MRGLILLMVILPGLALTLRYPFVGVLLWSWFSLQAPHQEVYGFATSLPLNLIIAVVSVAAWLFSRERKTLPMGPILIFVLLLLAWMTFNSFFAFNPAWSWPYWDRTWKIFALGIMIAMTATSRLRIQALLWLSVISLFYYGVKGGIFTILTGGHNHVYGPPSTIIADNNQLAVALLMSLPIAVYLRNQSSNALVRRLLLAGSAMTVIAIFGTYSRGAIVGLAALGLFMLLRTRRRILYISTSAIVIAFAVYFMPASYQARISGIDEATHEASFEGRVHAWHVAYAYASKHFPFGAGFYGPQLPAIFHQYYPNEDHAAHSIYFQVLGEHGFIGLAIYLFLIAAAFWRCSRLIGATRGDPSLSWIRDLATSLQASLFVFCVAGAALSMAYYDLFVMEVCLLLPLTQLARIRVAKPAPRAMSGAPAHAASVR